MPSGKLGLIDYGQIKALTFAQRKALARMIVALADGKEQEVIDQFVQMGFRSKRMDPEVIAAVASLYFDRDDQKVTKGVNLQVFFERLQKRDPFLAMVSRRAVRYERSWLRRQYNAAPTSIQPTETVGDQVTKAKSTNTEPKATLRPQTTRTDSQKTTSWWRASPSSCAGSAPSCSTPSPSPAPGGPSPWRSCGRRSRTTASRTRREKG